MAGWNRRVLELGAASGHVTRGLVAQQCRVTAVEYDASAAKDLDGLADRIIVGDLNDPATLADLPASFDVALAGDVLEHLIDPQAVVNRMAQLIVPHGRLVISLPNIAHADVRLALVQGRFDYTPSGLLDRTHLRFFTLKTISELIRQAGLQMLQMSRVVVPAFETELGIDRHSVPTAVLDEVLADPEAETYQFVFAAVRDDGNDHATARSEPHLDLQAPHRHEAVTSARQSIDLARQLREERKLRKAAEHNLARLQATKLFRYTWWPRKAYSALRGGDQ
jgi:2-polyprenyl-3-methyl-5-hydroxy-6-metoxy-1,4-benzoquinol methylase